jgi:hypothetical protein
MNVVSATVINLTSENQTIIKFSQTIKQISQPTNLVKKLLCLSKRKSGKLRRILG